MSESLVFDGIRAQLGNFVLGPIDIEISAGVTALVGVNGSGKTTLIRAALGLVSRSEGSLIWQGKKLSRRSLEIQKHIGYVPDGQQFLFPELTAFQYWSFVAAVRGSSFGEDEETTLDRATKLATEFRFSELDEPVSQLSHGMAKKVEIISTLMWEPEVILLDEPQDGLDFVSSHQLRKLLAQVADRGGVVLMSSHDMDSVARSATKLILLRAGAVAAVSDTPFTSGDECEAFAARYLNE